MPPRLVSLAVLLSALASGPGAAWALQEPTAGGSGAGPDAVADATPAPIPAVEVPEAAEQTMADLRRMEAALAPREAVAAVAGVLAARTPEIRSMREVLDRLDPERASARYLHDLRLDWDRLARDLERLRSRVDDRWRALQEIEQQIDRQLLRWRATRTGAAEARFPAELLARAESVEAELRRVERLARRRSEAVARVIDRISEERQAADAAVERLDEYAALVRSRLLERDDVPLWQLGERAGGQTLEVEARAAQRYWLATLQRWVREGPGRVLLLIALLLVFVTASFSLRRRSGGWPADEGSLAAARHVASRPLSAGLAFALAAWLLFVGVVPSPVNDLVGVLAAVPVLRLGLGLVAPVLRPALVGIVAASVVASLWSLSPDHSILRRLVLLAGTALAFVGARLVRRAWRRRAASGAWGRAVAWGLDLAAALLAVSVVCNVLGWVSLAQLLGDGTLHSAFAAVGWLVVARAAQGLLPLLRSGSVAESRPILMRQGARLERLGRAAVTLAAVVLWGWGALARFDLHGPARTALAELLAASVKLGSLDFSMGAVLFAVAILVLLVPLSRGLHIGLQEEVLPRLRLPAGADNSVLTLVNYTVVGLGLVLAASATGLGSTQLALVFGALGVGIGFGLQNIVNNFVSGLILIFERPIKVGDRIETAAHLGVVTRIGIRSSTVRTFDGAEVVVPNADLISKEVINWTLSDQLRRVEVRVGTAYGSDPHRVIEVLREVAAAEVKVLDDPTPLAVMIGFGDSSLDFRLLVWAPVEDFLDVGSRLHLAIFDALGQAGIEIPFPQRDLHLRSVAPAAAADLGREREPAGAD